ncbi:glycoside hydrolase family 97 catalytic domain-containing protein [Planctomycetota bacterium]|nr:glycoside hydrolase family 97 catalytic domain-containing protein [Planctomycetota bacterium]
MASNVFKLLLLTSLIFTSPLLAKETTLTIGHKDIKFAITSSDGYLSYTLSKNGQNIIEPSPLGITVDNIAWGSGNTTIHEAAGGTRESHDYKLPWGEKKYISNRYTEDLYSFNHSETKIRMYIRVRMFDDGIGFRYELQGTQPDGQVTASDELTAFTFDQDYPAWTFVRLGMQAISAKPISQLQEIRETKRGPRTLLPVSPVVIKKANDTYVAIHEAKLDSFAPAFLTPFPQPDGKAALEVTLGGGKVTNLPQKFVTPWRVIIFGKTPGDLIESDIILNLNDPPNPRLDYSWVKPSKLIWDWRGRGATTDDWTYELNTETCLRYIDKAKSLGLDGFMIDAHWYDPKKVKNLEPELWHTTGPVDMPKVAEYAKQQNVDLWLYFNHPELSRYQPEKIFDLLSEWNVKGVKNGFLHDANQKNVAGDMRMLELARQHKIMYDVHEPLKPTGLRRTYPHYVSREFVHALADGARMATPSYHATAAYLAAIAGPVDQTPGIIALNNATAERHYVRNEIQSTATAQIARCLIYYSGILNLSDIPEAYEQRADLFEFVQKMPMTWDDTRFIQGEIGKYIVIARRSKNKWFIAAITNEEARNITLNLSFIGNLNSKTARIYADAPDAHYLTNREPYQITDKTFTNTNMLKLELAPGGGACVWIR